MKKEVLIFLFVGILFFACSSPTIDKNSQQTLDIQLDNLVSQIISSLSENNKVKIGVIEFSDIQGNVTNLGKYVAEELTTKLYRTNQFEIVERQLMNKLLQEQELSLHGYIDIDSEIGIGKVLGVDAIVSGSITDLGNSIKINARIISPESGKVFSVASVKITKDATVKKLLAQTVSTTNNSTSGTTSKTQNQITDKNGLSIAVLNAKISGRTVTVEMNLTNTTEDDIKFAMIIGFDNKDYATMIYDNLGNETFISGIKLGNQFTNLINSVTQYAGASKKVIAGSSVNMELTFEKISSKVSKISLLQINAGNGNILEFRDIPINK